MTSRPSYSPYSPTGKSGPQFHVTDYLRVLHKRRWTAALAFLAVFAWGTFSTLKKTPIYEASAEVLIEKDSRRASSLNNVLEERESWDADFYSTQHKILKSRALAWRAIESLHLNTPAAVAPAPDRSAGKEPPGLFGGVVDWAKNLVGAPKLIDPPAADETTAQSALISNFLGGLEVVPVRNTHLVDLRYQHPDPAFAMRAANAIAQQYRAQSLQTRFLASKETSSWLDEALKDQKAKVEISDAALQKYKETHDAVSLDAGQNIVVQKLSDLTAAATRAKTDRIGKEIIYNRVESLLKAQDRAAIEALPAIAASDIVQKLKTTLVEQNATRTKLTARYLPDHWEVIDINNQIKLNQAKLDQEVDKVVENVRSEYLAAQETERQLTQMLNAQKGDTLSLNRMGLEYANLQRESASNHTLYDSLLQKAKETGVTGEYKGSNIQIVDLAEVPRAPVLPQTSHDLFVAFVEGLFLAFALAFGFEYLDNRIRTPDEIKAYLGLPFLGIVPTVGDPKPDEEQVLLLNKRVPPTFGEAMRAIRTAVIFSSADEGARSVVITSTAPSEGKTVVSANLAVSLAQADQRTLVIDGDLRRPRVHEVFGRPQEPGLSNVLVGTTELHEAVRPTAVPNLFLLPAGHLPPNPAELLSSNKFREILRDMRHQFDWIIIDAPPVMAVTDAAIVANQTTGVVFVVGAEMTVRRNAVAAIDQLTAAKAHFIGAVLNRVDLDKHSYYYSPYYRKDYTRAYERAR